MTVLTDLAGTACGETSVALGYFDGVHLGHRAVLRGCLTQASQNGSIPAVFTFHYSDPAEEGKGGLLTSRREKHRLMESLGIGCVMDVPFEEISAMAGQDFFDKILVGALRARAVTCGADFRFGFGAACGTDELAEMCRRAGMNLTVIPDQTMDGEPVHSTRIRRWLEAGDIPHVNRLLGRPYSVTGTVIHGNHLGRTVGMPTVNMQAEPDMVLPPFGVYASRTVVGGTAYDSITNIGVKPTVGSDRVLYETFLFDFSQDVYGQEATVQLYEFVRPERKFSSLQAVKEQVSSDILQVKKILGSKEK